MQFEVYCDEAFPDLFTSAKPKARYLMIGGIWLPANLREEVKTEIKILRNQHNTWGEIKWTKVSPSRLDFYLDLVNIFYSYGNKMRFRCIAVNRAEVDPDLHDGDPELGFYKFYYQLLHHWIQGLNKYSIFCDMKSNRDNQRLRVLKRVLNNAHQLAEIQYVQALPSKQVLFIQLADLLLGVASSRLNETLKTGTAKEKVVLALEECLGLDHPLAPTWKHERKFNIFKINLRRGL